MKRQKLIGILLLLIIPILCFYGGCSSSSIGEKSSSGDYGQEGSSQGTEADELGEGGDRPEIDFEQKIIKNGDLSMEVEDLSAAEETLAELTKKYEGYLSDSNLNVQKNKKTIFMLIKVPQQNFENFFSEIKEMGKVDHSRVSTQDITTEYIDLESRLGTQEAQEKRLVELYDKASTVEEMLKIENELTRLRGSIENLRGQLEYLDHSVSYSAVEIRLYQKLDLSDSAQVNFKDGWDLFANTMVMIVKGVLLVWPFILLAMIVYAIFRLRKRNKGKSGD